ncbi:metalloproteinase inhibitor 3-like [Microplitis mediator]|uniref:metalloproteinase inhibitor 3-like n=1 Tax=Microplitis mediator TaxID=375433 RepID=UPI002552E735|nr:metalloproteinase inhibitor 3-like [Microplitis mediator]
MKRFLILFILGLLTIDYTNGCRCVFTPLQDSFCNSDFVIKIKVTDTGKTQESIKNIYHIDILETYRANPEAVEALKLKYFLTNPDGASCGLPLNRDQVAVVGGHIIDGKPSIGLCNLNIENPQEIDAESVNLRENFSKNCATASTILQTNLRRSK